MFSREMIALMAQGLWETLYMTVLSTAAAYVLGLPVGLLLVVTDKDGISQLRGHRIVGILVQTALGALIICLFFVLPLDALQRGHHHRLDATIVPLVIAAPPRGAPDESSVKEEDWRF
jgi:D-methionine transport system permease protein